jgi:hypothetical protein
VYVCCGFFLLLQYNTHVKKLRHINLIILFTVKEEMVYEACGNQDYEEVVKRSEESVQDLQVCVCVVGGL